jgi:hypothetical protein
MRVDAIHHHWQHEDVAGECDEKEGLFHFCSRGRDFWNRT